MLERNYLACLREKAARDAVEERACKVEYILWYLTECPAFVARLREPAAFRARAEASLAEE